MPRSALRCLLAVAFLAAAPAAFAGQTMDLVFAERDFSALGQGPVRWHLTRTGPEVEGFQPLADGQLTLALGADPDIGRPMLELRESGGGRERLIARYPTAGMDPVLVYFLETATRHMAALAGGSPFYIRNRIKEALRRGGAVVDSPDGGRIVILSPFAGDRNADRMRGFDRLTLQIGLAPQPGAPIRSLEAEAPGTGYAFKLAGGGR
ncbi:hypothetical protein GI374_14125 [Paracoccus sp. S-4012]|uniref:hypothetical protein n=1 Tax=Paracoccus sp. S-4012 TaxID=2665648 RepID=UPI0012AF9EA0|nr:hypothetical protein [Paracoccus sp. S-4012]MRX51556.1 hypothetical protein [Paracoccus sp. S-4012]